MTPDSLLQLGFSLYAHRTTTTTDAGQQVRSTRVALVNRVDGRKTYGFGDDFETALSGAVEFCVTQGWIKKEQS
jgi:hypothetical protein